MPTVKPIKTKSADSLYVLVLALVCVALLTLAALLLMPL